MTKAALFIASWPVLAVFVSLAAAVLTVADLK